jgi:2-polyprenyl-3-methyl-5-hydroxy-6-metoxy-1,4-benzoquinol methylase
MSEYDKYFKTNKSLWDQKTAVHEKSDFYNLKSFLNNGNSLNTVEEELLGDVSMKKIIHLQCHFGMDSISLARKGATVTAIDLSSKSIVLAKSLNEKMHTSVRFIESNVYDIPDKVQETFDIVFTSYGALCWLPDLGIWAEIVEKLLKPGGKLVMVEFHPTLYLFDHSNNTISYDYFNRSVYEESTEGTYAETSSTIKHKEYFWNHSLAEVIQPLISRELKLDFFEEYDYSPYNCFENMVKRKKNEFVYRGISPVIPHIYSIVVSKKFDI